MQATETHESDGGGHEGGPTRVCPHCSTVSHTSGEYCPHCGQPLVRRTRVSRRARIGAFAVTAILVLAGGAIAVAVSSKTDKTTASSPSVPSFPLHKPPPAPKSDSYTVILSGKTPVVAG